MAPGRFLANLLVIVIFSAGGFGLMHWLESPRPHMLASMAAPVNINPLSGCISAIEARHEENGWSNRLGAPHNPARLAVLTRDCSADQQGQSHMVPR